MKSKLEIIQETAAHYNLGNRSIENLKCAYIGAEGKHCAFGRCCDLDDPEKVRFLKSFNSKGCGFIFSLKGQQILKPEYRGHEERFWRDIQNLHDNRGGWTETGLSETGNNCVELLIQRWA